MPINRFNDRPFSAPLLKLHVMRIPTTTKEKGEGGWENFKSKQYCSPKRMISRSLETSIDPRFVSCMQSTVTRPMISLTNKSCKLAGSLLPSSQILHSLDVFPRCSHTMDRRTEVQISSCCSSLHLGLSQLSPSHRLNLDTYEMVRRRPADSSPS